MSVKKSGFQGLSVPLDVQYVSHSVPLKARWNLAWFYISTNILSRWDRFTAKRYSQYFL